VNLGDVGHIKKPITHKPDWIKSPQAIFSFLSQLLLLPSPSPQKPSPASLCVKVCVEDLLPSASF